MSSLQYRRKVPWLVLGFVVIGALIVGTRSDGPQTREDRVLAIARTIECPECNGQSVASSGAASARAIKRDIGERLDRGQSGDQIRDYYAGRFGESLLLTPRRSGVSGLVWIIPVVAVVIAVAGLAAAFARWRRGSATEATDEDRALVAAAMADPHGEGQGR
jgi:cytochrome c-type biogenesis protein CcmH